jgi:hypothetical protein
MKPGEARSAISRMASPSLSLISYSASYSVSTYSSESLKYSEPKESPESKEFPESKGKKKLSVTICTTVTDRPKKTVIPNKINTSASLFMVKVGVLIAFNFLTKQTC